MEVKANSQEMQALLAQIEQLIREGQARTVGAKGELPLLAAEVADAPDARIWLLLAEAGALRTKGAQIAAAVQTNPSGRESDLFRSYSRAADLLLIRWALTASRGDRSRAARFLGLSRAALYKKLKLYPELGALP